MWKVFCRNSDAIVLNGECFGFIVPIKENISMFFSIFDGIIQKIIENQLQINAVAGNAYRIRNVYGQADVFIGGQLFTFSD